MAIDLFDTRSVVTVVSFITFVAIIVWAYSGRRKQAFDTAALLPFTEEDEMNSINTESRHG